MPVPKVLERPGHQFLTDDKTRLVSLSQDFIAISEKSYQKWDLFREEVKLAERAFRGIYQPAFYTRIGLRYRDVLDRDDLNLHGRSWSELLNLSFIGELGAEVLTGEVEDIRTQSLVRLPDVPNGMVRIQHGLTRTPDGDKQVYVIDSDFYTAEKTELDDAFQKLDIFNRWGGRLFRWAISDRLRDALGPT